MPKKLQIKLLSQSGELLNVTNCAAGQISVLRAESPSELKPYQRALSGFQGKERFVIVLDNTEYRHEQHHLIGFGEIPPHSGQTVAQYLIGEGLTEGSVDSLLMAFGLENCAERQCSSLSLDEERRVRILGTTISAEKALILNEPFEPISSQWRERFAEYLSEYARTKNGLVIVASLSYRPDNWIDNATISRQQVGQALRKTIGFGSHDSETTQLMNQLRDQLRQEQSDDSSRPLAAAASFGAIATATGSADEQEANYVPHEIHAPWWQQPFTLVALKGASALGAGSIGIWAALTFTGVLDAKDQGAPARSAKTAMATTSDQTLKKIAESKGDTTAQHAAASLNGGSGEKIKTALLLDKYPEVIKAALLDTSRGVMGEVAVSEEPIQAQPAQQKSGSLYSLLESASSDKPEPGGDSGGVESSYEEPQSSGGWSEPEQSEPVDASEEESRREAIRQKFLEAIRAAAERRQQEGEE